MKESVYCSVGRHEELNTLVNSLKSAGFAPEDISVVLDDKPGTWDEGNGRAAEGTTIGAGAGAALGGAFGLMAALGLVAVPVAGPFLAAGPLLAALGGAAAGTALGGLAGGFVGMGVPKEQAEKFAGSIHEGSAVVAVHTPNQESMDKAVQLCEKVNATDITRVEGPEVLSASKTTSA